MVERDSGCTGELQVRLKLQYIPDSCTSQFFESLLGRPNLNFKVILGHYIHFIFQIMSSEHNFLNPEIDLCLWKFGSTFAKLDQLLDLNLIAFWPYQVCFYRSTAAPYQVCQNVTLQYHIYKCNGIPVKLKKKVFRQSTHVSLAIGRAAMGDGMFCVGDLKPEFWAESNLVLSLGNV